MISTAIRMLSCGLVYFTLSSLTATAAPAPVGIYVSIAPLRYFVERVGGRHVRVEVLVKPGHSPVTYEPSPRQMASLTRAKAFVRMGVPFEMVWLKPIRENNPNIDIVDVRDGIVLTSMPGPSFGMGGDVPANRLLEFSDPHIWLAPPLAVTITKNIRDYLVRADPVNAADYVANAERLASELKQLDAEIAALTRGIENRKFLVFHPAWGYFARTYGLEQLAVQYAGKSPGPNALAKLLELANREGIRTIFVQKQFDSRIAAALAAEINGRVVVLDPLAEDYFENLRQAAHAISESNGA